MTAKQRQALRERFRFRCGYCGIEERQAGAELTIDHFQPRSRGGTDQSDNLIYCCHACNEFKADYWQPDSDHRILHPLRDDLAGHVRASDDGTLVGITTTGSFHIERPQLNRPALVMNRLERRGLGAARAIQRALVEQLTVVEQELGALRLQIEKLETRQD